MIYCTCEQLFICYKKESDPMERTFIIHNLDCAHCGAKIETALNNIDGIESAVLNYPLKKLIIKGDITAELIELINKTANSIEAGVVISPAEHGHHHHHSHNEHHDECDCGHSHEHHHHDECGCGHSHEHHHHDECGCGHSHEHLHLAGIMISGKETIEISKTYLPICGTCLIGVDYLFVFRNGCQGFGKPLVPMISGILEMALRVGVIALFIPVVGFSATAYAEASAWIGAMLMNMAAFEHTLRSNLKSPVIRHKKLKSAA